MGTLEAPVPLITMDTAAAPAASAQTEDEQAVQISASPVLTTEDTAGKTEEEQGMQISETPLLVTNLGVVDATAEATDVGEVGQGLQTSEALAPVTTSDVTAAAPAAPDLQDVQSMQTSAVIPLTILDVAGAALAARAQAVDEPELASSRLAKLFSSAQSGKEASHLVRSLQGKLAPAKA